MSAAEVRSPRQSVSTLQSIHCYIYWALVRVFVTSLLLVILPDSVHIINVHVRGLNDRPCRIGFAKCSAEKKCPIRETVLTRNEINVQNPIPSDNQHKFIIKLSVKLKQCLGSCLQHETRVLVFG